MNKSEFRYVWLKGWKLEKIAKHFSITEKEALSEFTRCFKAWFNEGDL